MLKKALAKIFDRADHIGEDTVSGFKSHFARNAIGASLKAGISAVSIPASAALLNITHAAGLLKWNTDADKALTVILIANAFAVAAYGVSQIDEFRSEGASIRLNEQVNFLSRTFD